MDLVRHSTSKKEESNDGCKHSRFFETARGQSKAHCGIKSGARIGGGFWLRNGSPFLPSLLFFQAKPKNHAAPFPTATATSNGQRRRLDAFSRAASGESELRESSVGGASHLSVRSHPSRARAPSVRPSGDTGRQCTIRGQFAAQQASAQDLRKQASKQHKQAHSDRSSVLSCSNKSVNQ